MYEKSSASLFFPFCHQHAVGKFTIHSLSPCYVCVCVFYMYMNFTGVIQNQSISLKMICVQTMFCSFKAIVSTVFVYMLYEPRHQHEIFPSEFLSLLAFLRFHLKRYPSANPNRPQSCHHVHLKVLFI